MEQYINDIKSFGNEKELVLCENLFNKTKKLLLESKDSVNGFKLLKESATNEEEKHLVKDFKMYVQMILEN